MWSAPLTLRQASLTRHARQRAFLLSCILGINACATQEIPEEPTTLLPLPTGFEDLRWVPVSPSSPAGEAVFIEWQSDSLRLRGHSGCNSFGAGYRTQTESRTVGSATGKLETDIIYGTRKACPPGVMEAEQSLFKQLSEVRSYRLSGYALRLDDEAGNTVLRFTLDKSRTASTAP